MKNNIKGKKFENLAAHFLKNKGYKIICQNYKNKIGEIDIIASINNITVFVEVKFRLSAKFGRPIEAINFYKQQKIRRVATLYLQVNKLLDSAVRFDCVEVFNDEITHIENAF